MTIQQKYLAALKTIAERHQLELVIQTDWANTGNVAFMKDWTTVANITFSFQSSYFTLAANAGNRHAQYSSNVDPDYRFYIENVQGEKIKNSLAVIESLLPRKAKRSTKKGA